MDFSKAFHVNVINSLTKLHHLCAHKNGFFADVALHQTFMHVRHPFIFLEHIATAKNVFTLTLLVHVSRRPK
jgi:hypothetical protein